MNEILGTIQEIKGTDKEHWHQYSSGRRFRVLTKHGWAFTVGRETAQLLSKREEKPRINPMAQIRANNQRIAEIERERIIHLIKAVSWQVAKDSGLDTAGQAMEQAEQIVIGVI